MEIAHHDKASATPEYLKSALINMACNHTVVKLEETGELIGDPMEIELLRFSNCRLTSETNNPYVIFLFEGQLFSGEVYKRYDFDSSLQRMSVVTKLNNDQTYIFAKGSPEIMLSIMAPSSIPSNYQSRLREFASSGYRILAIASRKLNSNWKELGRDQI